MRLSSRASFASIAASTHSKLYLSRLLTEDAHRCFSTLNSLSPGQCVAHILHNEFGAADGSSPSSASCKQEASKTAAGSANVGGGKPQFNHLQQHDDPQLETQTPHPPVLGPKHCQDSPHLQTRECQHEEHNDHCAPGLALRHRNDSSHLIRRISPFDPSSRDERDSKCIFKNANSERHALDDDSVKAPKQPPSCTKTSQDIMKLLIDRVNTQSWIALNKDIDEFNIEINPKEVAWVLKVLKDPNRARELFIWAAQRPGYAHDATCYAVMINSLGDILDHVFLNNLLQQMEKKNIQLNVSIINRLIGIFVSRDEIDRAEHYFLKLQDLRLQPNAFTYKCMLQAFAKGGQCKKALDTYRKMQKEDQPIDLVTYNILLDGLSRNGQAESAWEIFEEMKRCGNPVDVYTYTIVARSYGQAGRAGKALDLLEEMVQNGVEPNKHTYNTLLNALANAGRPDDAVKLFKKMSTSGLYPDVVSCQSILKALFKGQCVGQTRELALCIKDVDIRKEVCESFIKGLSKMGHLQDVRALFKIIRADNLWPSLSANLSMIDALCRGAEPNEAMIILKEVEDKAVVVPLTTYNTILSALRNSNQFQVAYDLFSQLEERGPSPDVVSYNIIISGLIKTRQLPHAERIFYEMSKSGCRPNVITFNSLLHCYARAGDVSSVRKLLKMMNANEVTPDIITYNCTIECFGKAGKPKVAVKVFKEMKEKGISPSYVTYNNVLLALAGAGLTDKVLLAFEQMKDQGFVPDALTFTILSRVYNRDPHLDKRKLREEIRKAGLFDSDFSLCTQRLFCLPSLKSWFLAILVS
ncbi:hypothetical protein GOP47_0008220 [Adiantum capillus-veneris]|uniref:Pentatricopeptide repeat-containing protein n=1 Tax=Adiantum capillus-veneris TaxID=13818 RepID=A0A9D4UXU9_ADICA|nr:hypothetical protein GOP47_0008220 [Adiantum capillus-veneris]